MDINNVLDEVGEVIAKGGVIIFPTDTIYGIGGEAYNQPTMERIYQIKKRTSRSPFSLHLGDVAEIKDYCHKLTKKQQGWLKDLLPGPYTVLLTARPNAPQSSVSTEGKIGIRIPDSRSFKRIYQAISQPIIGTSVNISGKPPLTDIADIVREFSDKVDLIVKTDQSMTGRASAVIDLTGDRPVAVRGSLPQNWEYN